MPLGLKMLQKFISIKNQIIYQKLKQQCLLACAKIQVFIININIKQITTEKKIASSLGINPSSVNQEQINKAQERNNAVKQEIRNHKDKVPKGPAPKPGSAADYYASKKPGEYTGD